MTAARPPHRPPRAAPAAPAIELLGTQVVPGFLRGLVQPCLRVQVQLAPGADARRCAGAAAALPPLPPACRSGGVAGLPPTPGGALALLLAEWLVRLQTGAGLEVSCGAVLELLRPLPGHPGRLQAVVLVPGPLPSLLTSVVAPLVAEVNALLLGTTGDPGGLERLRTALARWAPAGTNNRHFLREAGALGIPVLPLPGGVFQLGWGRRARLFKSSITDTTPAVASAWARDKVATNALFRMAGLPVPAQRAVPSLDAALKAAQQMGYPVVIKPVNLDQGLGVEADLRNEAELRAAYGRSVRHGSPLVLEQHVRGDDYRVYTMDGELLGVAHRVPAQVLGDGVATVAQLVAAANVLRRQGAGHVTVYKPIELDAEALDLLAREGFEPGSVVPAGRALRLRRSANASRGGTSLDVTARIHPDNAALCLQAAALLRLDIAGLDLLIPDIARSWREVGAAFCEANAQPQMGGAHPWIFERILQRAVTARGRVPAVLVLGPSGEPVLGLAVVQALGRAGWPAALVHGRGADLIGRTRAAVMRPALGAVVVQTDGVGMDQSGLPLDAFDVLVISDWALPATAQAAVLAWLTLHVRGVALVDEPVDAAVGVTSDGAASVGPCRAVLGRCLGAQRVQWLPGAPAVPAAVLRHVQTLSDGG
jgi:cyanophycin synthetase